jgi:hypothetical protein
MPWIYVPYKLCDAAEGEQETSTRQERVEIRLFRGSRVEELSCPVSGLFSLGRESM